MDLMTRPSGNFLTNTGQSSRRSSFLKRGSAEDAPQKSSGFGFVRLSSAEEARAVITAANGLDCLGHTLCVRTDDRPAGGGAAYSKGLGNGWEREPMENLYIKGLPSYMTEEDLRRLFLPYGPVLSVRMFPGVTPDGFDAAALLRCGSVEQARWFVQHLNGNMVEGLSRPITVRYADTPGTRGQKQAGKAGAAMDFRSSPYGVPTPAQARAIADRLAGGPDMLRVENLPAMADDLYLYKVFAPCGAIETVYCSTTPEGSCSGVGFVKFARPEDAAVAYRAVNGTMLPDGNLLKVVVKHSRRKARRPSPPTTPPPAEILQAASAKAQAASATAAATQAPAVAAAQPPAAADDDDDLPWPENWT